MEVSSILRPHKYLEQPGKRSPAICATLLHSKQMESVIKKHKRKSFLRITSVVEEIRIGPLRRKLHALLSRLDTLSKRTFKADNCFTYVFEFVFVSHVLSNKPGVLYGLFHLV